MNILISGSTGLIGSSLVSALTTAGHTVYPLLRDSTEGPHRWDTRRSVVTIDPEIQLDAVIHLAGENIAARRWDEQQKARIMDSRIGGTKALVEALLAREQLPSCFIGASAIGFYGDTGQSVADEDSPAGEGFLSEIATRWESETTPLREVGIRTVNLRTGIVLSTDGGALAKMLLPFRLGLGGRVGDGQQMMSWISIDDVVSAIRFLLEGESSEGPYNLVAPKAVNNSDFTRALGSALHRPTVFPMPAAVVKILFGEMGEALLLSSSHVTPKRLTDAGFRFRHGTIDSCLRDIL